MPRTPSFADPRLRGHRSGRPRLFEPASAGRRSVGCGPVGGPRQRTDGRHASFRLTVDRRRSDRSDPSFPVTGDPVRRPRLRDARYRSLTLPKRRLQSRLDESLYDGLRRRAFERRISKDSVARETVVDALTPSRPPAGRNTRSADSSGSRSPGPTRTAAPCRNTTTRCCRRRTPRNSARATTSPLRPPRTTIDAEREGDRRHRPRGCGNEFRLDARRTSRGFVPDSDRVIALLAGRPTGRAAGQRSRGFRLVFERESRPEEAPPEVASNRQSR